MPRLPARLPFLFGSPSDPTGPVVAAAPPRGPNPGPLEFTKTPNYTAQVKP